MGLITLSYRPGGGDPRSISSLMGNLDTLVNEFNGNITGANILDGSIGANDLAPGLLVPVGGIAMYGGAAAPTNWLLCDGASLLRAGTYAALFTAIGTAFGTVDGTHFTLPDLRGRTPIGVGTGPGLSARALAAAGGEENHTLSLAEAPAHTHGPGTGGQFIKQDTGGPSGFVLSSGVITPSNVAQTDSKGGGGGHNNMQPFVSLNYIIRYA